MADLNLTPYEDIYSEIKETLLLSRNQAYSAVNFAMVQAYWQIGRIIVEHEQDGNARAGYGKSVLQELSSRLTKDFGKGFSVRTLQQMKKFYVIFPNTNALRSQLTWTHYRLLLSVENEQARQWYMDEAIASAWSSRQLERQISTLYYERLLASREQTPVRAEAVELTTPLATENFIKDPYVLEFRSAHAPISAGLVPLYPNETIPSKLCSGSLPTSHPWSDTTMFSPSRDR